MQRPRNPLLAFLFIVALVLPWLIFLFLPGGTITGHVLFWLVMFFCFLLLWMVSATQLSRGSIGVEWQYQKILAESAVKKLRGVTGITNDIEVKPQASPQEARSQVEEA